MPELPEVETIKRALKKTIVGKTIAKVIVSDGYVIKEPSGACFKRQLEGATIVGVERKGKALIMQLSSEKFLIVHLRMTGQLLCPGNGKKSRISFLFTDGSSCDYNDQRKLGSLRLVAQWHTIDFFKRMGPEPGDITVDDFASVLSENKRQIKPLLMDQQFIAGVGNLYAAEALFQAKIHPCRRAHQLSPYEKKRLLFALRSILKKAIKNHGSSIDQYVTVSGRRGNFVRFHRVYGREGKACSVCKTRISRIALGGRGTYFCARCQK